MSDAERDEFEFEPIEDLTDAETPGDELAEPLEPLDDAEIGEALEPDDDAEMGEALEPAEDAEMADAAEPADDAEVAEGIEPAEGFEDESAFPAEEALAGAAIAAEGEAEEEAAGEEDEEGEEKPEKKKGELLASIREASPFTVMLIVAFVALLIGILCLVGELAQYDGDIKAEKAKRGTAMITVPYSAPLSRTLAACPTSEKLDFNTNGDVA